MHPLGGEEARGTEPVLVLRQRLLAAVDPATTRSIFPAAGSASSPLLRRQEKERVWDLWQLVLDCTIALDRAAQLHGAWMRGWSSRPRTRDFVRHHAAFLAAYRGALDFIGAVERDPRLDPVLNDAVPELGMPAGTYDVYKLRFLNAALGAQFALLRAASFALDSDRHDSLKAAADEDSAFIWDAGLGRGSALTAKNAIAVLRKEGLKAWFPIQRRASLAVSHLRLPVRKGGLIRRRQLREILPLLAPGDVLLQRREWVFTNVGLPGFWTHAALFVGTPKEREVLASDASVLAWLSEYRGGARDLEACLGAGAATCRRAGDHFPARVIEALAPGVILSSLERSAACDGLAVLRPRLSPHEKAAALIRAFHFVGRPYDFAFNFETDSALVCSEVVVKSYEAGEGTHGLSLPMKSIAGHAVVPPNDLARVFDAEAEREDRPFNLVCFLDGREAEHRAVLASEGDFRASWRRPKWHVFMQSPASSGPVAGSSVRPARLTSSGPSGP